MEQLCEPPAASKQEPGCLATDPPLADFPLPVTNQTAPRWGSEWGYKTQQTERSERSVRKVRSEKQKVFEQRVQLMTLTENGE